MNILITGAGGFIGRNLKEFLSPKYNIFAATHDDLELLDDKAVEEYVNGHLIDVIIHCAAVGGSRKTNYDPGSTDVVEKNLRMFFNLERCLKQEMRMIHLGSGAEYDRRHWRHKMDEDYFDQYVPSDSYGYSKYLISKYIKKKHNIICLYLFGVFGKYEDYRFKFISNAIVKNLLHMPICINQNVVFDYLDINDLGNVIEHFLGEIPSHKHYNVTPTKSIDLIALADIINNISNFQSDIVILHDGLNMEYSGDNSRLLNEYPSIVFESYQSSIKKLFHYYSNVLHTLDISSMHNDPFLEYCQINESRIEMTR
jgi:GDP-L-fucose synthase